MATPQSDPLASAKNVLASANKFEKSADPTGVQKPKAAAPAPASMPAAKPAVNEPGLGAELRSKAQNIREYSDNLPKMHTGGMVEEDGDYKLQMGEKVIPASGRQSEYRKAFEERGRQGLHKYGQSAKEQTRQVGGNTPVKGEEHVKGEKKIAVPNKD
jgi:hypothetical protein